MQGVKSVTKQAFMKFIPIMCSYVFVSMAYGLWKLIAAVITAVSYKWKHNTLISILLGTVSYMLFLHFFG